MTIPARTDSARYVVRRTSCCDFAAYHRFIRAAAHAAGYYSYDFERDAMDQALALSFPGAACDRWIVRRRSDVIGFTHSHPLSIGGSMVTVARLPDAGVGTGLVLGAVCLHIQKKKGAVRSFCRIHRRNTASRRIAEFYGFRPWSGKLEEYAATEEAQTYVLDMPDFPRPEIAARTAAFLSDVTIDWHAPDLFTENCHDT